METNFFSPSGVTIRMNPIYGKSFDGWNRYIHDWNKLVGDSTKHTNKHQAARKARFNARHSK